jgi:phosphoglycolate phosphatase
MYDLLVFDWDGTLIDSAARIISSMHKATLDLPLDPVSDEAIRNIIGLGLPEVMQQLFPGIDAHIQGRACEAYSHYYLHDKTPTQLFPGVEAGLLRLKESGYQLAVATGKSRQGLDRVFEETGLGSLFAYSRCADETRSKPHPLMLHQILEESGFSVERSLMVGDTEYDLGMAQQAEMDAVAVSYGAHSPARLKPYGPVLNIDHFCELERWLDSKSMKDKETGS